MVQEEKTHFVCNKILSKQRTKHQNEKTRSAGQRCQLDRLRCSKCQEAFRNAYWTRYERRQHLAGSSILVCKACRAQGFRPWNLETFTCQACKSNIGMSKFTYAQRRRYKQCIAGETGKKRAASAIAASSAASTNDVKKTCTRTKTKQARQQQGIFLICKRCQSKRKTKQQKQTRSDSNRRLLHHHQCRRCKIYFEDAKFPQKPAGAHSRKRVACVCEACRDQGFHCRNLSAYTCQTCKGNFGSRRFKEGLLKRYKQRHYVQLQCTRCDAQKSKKAATASMQKMTQQHRLRCSKCKTEYEDACWTRVERQNHRAQHTPLVCEACRAQGFHPRNLEAYACQTCRSNLGSKRFNQVMLYNYKQRPGAKLECMQCFALKAQKEIRDPPRAPAAPTQLIDVPPALLA